MSASLITMPTSSCVARVSINIVRTVARTESPFTLNTQTFKWPGEQWQMTFDLPPIVSRAIAAEWIAFGAKMEGSYNYFLFGDPSAKTPRGVATGTPVVAGAGQTGNTLQTSGWTAGVTGILKAGDYIQTGSGVTAVLNMVASDVNSDGSGNANIPLILAMRSSPVSGSAIVTSDAKGLFRMDDNTFGWEVLPGPRYSIGFSASEVINA